MGDSSIDNYQCYVGCLHHTIGDEEFLTLAKCFSTNVVSSRIVRSQTSDTHLGYGFVQYTDSSAADDAILLMQGVYAKGFPLVVRSTSHYTASYDPEEPQSGVNTTVHVSNLSEDNTREDVMELAKPFGEVESINLVSARKYCFVNFKRREFALGFLCHMDNWNTGKSTISCFWALHSVESKAFDRKLLDKEREDEAFGVNYAKDLLPKKMDYP